MVQRRTRATTGSALRPFRGVREILRGPQLGERASRIARDLGVSRNTVAHYQRWAATYGLLTGPLPEPVSWPAALLTAPPVQRPAPEQSFVEPCGELGPWLRPHNAAFEFFGGVPRRVVLDNLHAAVRTAAGSCRTPDGPGGTAGRAGGDRAP